MPRLPSLTARELIAALQRAGLRIVDDEGKHTRPWREGLPRPVMVPRHTREVKRGLLADIIKQAGLTQEEFRKALKEYAQMMTVALQRCGVPVFSF